MTDIVRRFGNGFAIASNQARQIVDELMLILGDCV